MVGVGAATDVLAVAAAAQNNVGELEKNRETPDGPYYRNPTVRSYLKPSVYHHK
jgi:hypothetical protein